METVTVEHGDAVRLAPSDAELERAIASVPGVASAAIDRRGGAGGSRLRLRLGTGEDARTIAWAVAATLRERFGIVVDPDAIRARSVTTVEGGPDDDPVRLVHTPVGEEVGRAGCGGGTAGAETDPVGELEDTRQRLTEAAQQALEGVERILSRRDAADAADATDRGEPAPRRGEAPWTRPVGPAGSRVEIQDLDVRRQDERVQVVATLCRGGQVARGLAGSVATTQGSYRAVAEATIDALRGLTVPVLQAGVDRVTVQPTDDPMTAAVVVSVLTGSGSLTDEEQLVGASMVRHDPHDAVMRATMDALNRRLTSLLPPVDLDDGDACDDADDDARDDDAHDHARDDAREDHEMASGRTAAHDPDGRAGGD